MTTLEQKRGPEGVVCAVCRKPVEPVALALTQKIVSREATEFRCLSCLAAMFKTTGERLLETARLYRDRGCVLFKGIDLK